MSLSTTDLHLEVLAVLLYGRDQSNVSVLNITSDNAGDTNCLALISQYITVFAKTG